MYLYNGLLCACFFMVSTVVSGVSSLTGAYGYSSLKSQTSVTSTEKIFIQGPQNNYLLNSSSLFLPTDFLTMNKPVSDVRSVVLNTGLVGGLNSLVPSGVESHAFKDSYDGDYFYQMWHLAHIDEKHQRTNVVTVIVSLGGIEVSPSGDIEDNRRKLDSSSVPKVYVQVYRAWSVPVTLPLTQANMDGWWHSITHAFHTVMHIYNEIKPWIGIARTVVPILISMSDTQSGLGLKSVVYLPEPQATTTTSSSYSTSSSDNVFAYNVTPGEMSAIVICVYLSGLISAIVIPKLYNRRPFASNNAYKSNNNGKLEVMPSNTTPFV